jgi:hypothetical protein
MSPHERRVADVSEALTRWRENRRPSDMKLAPALLYGAHGALDAEVINRLAGQRDDRRVSLRE